MRIYLANYDPERAGGGWTFARNFVKGMGDAITNNYDEADTYFICGPTMVQRDEVEKAGSDGKKVVLRLDNAVRNSRNRNTGMSRMHDFAQWADLVIYQSEWAKQYLMPFTGVDGPVILNGADTEMFKSQPKIAGSAIYSRQNRDETKNWEATRYWYSQSWVDDPELIRKLFIVGNFSPELVEGNFDFYNNEPYEYMATLSHPAYAKILSTMEHFVYSYYNDACSNSLIEALACGCAIIDPHHFLETGGAPEIMAHSDLSLERMIKEYRYELGKL